MNQAQIDLLSCKKICKYCDQTFTTSEGLNRHAIKAHPFEVEVYSCYTCNKIFTRREIQAQHFKTVQHQINCKRSEGADSQIDTIIDWINMKEDDRFKAYMYEIDNIKPNPAYQKKKTENIPVFEPTLNIPLEADSNMTDPRVEMDAEEEIDNLVDNLIQAMSPMEVENYEEDIIPPPPEFADTVKTVKTEEEAQQLSKIYPDSTDSPDKSHEKSQDLHNAVIKTSKTGLNQSDLTDSDVDVITPIPQDILQILQNSTDLPPETTEKAEKATKKRKSDCIFDILLEKYLKTEEEAENSSKRRSYLPPDLPPDLYQDLSHFILSLPNDRLW